MSEVGWLHSRIEIENSITISANFKKHLQADFALSCFTLLHFTDTVFNKLMIYANPINAIFPTVFAFCNSHSISKLFHYYCVYYGDL